MWVLVVENLLSWEMFDRVVLGYGNFFGHVILGIGIFWTCDFGHGNFLDTRFWS